MRPHRLLKQRHQFGLHEGVVVGDVEADDAGALQMGPEAALEFGARPLSSSSGERSETGGPSGAEGDLFMHDV